MVYQLSIEICFEIEHIIFHTIFSQMFDLFFQIIQIIIFSSQLFYRNISNNFEVLRFVFCNVSHIFISIIFFIDEICKSLESTQDQNSNISMKLNHVKKIRIEVKFSLFIALFFF